MALHRGNESEDFRFFIVKKARWFHQEDGVEHIRLTDQIVCTD